MNSFNQVTLTGNLVKAPETRYTTSGMAVGNFTIAINKEYKEKKSVSFFDITVWDKQAENCVKYLQKGSSVLISGELEQKIWENKEGQKRSKIIINARIVQFLSTKSSGGTLGTKEDYPKQQQGPQGRQADSVYDDEEDDDIPF